MAIDKTGTLTNGVPRVVGLEPADGELADELIRLAAAMEQQSEHPLATAIVDAASERRLAIPHAKDFSALRGFGVEATVYGEKHLIGNSRLMQQRGIRLPTEVSGMDTGRPTANSSGSSTDEPPTTVAYVARGDRLVGTVRLADTLRSDAAKAIAQLKELGIHNLWILSGDHQRVARQVASQIGIDSEHVMAE